MERFVKTLMAPYEYGVLYGGLLLFAGMCLAWSLAAGVLRHVLRRTTGERVGQYAIMLVFRMFLGAVRMSGLVRCDLSGLDALRNERGVMIVTNHPSLIDVVLIASRLPRSVCILKAELLDNPLLGGGARMAGYLRNDSAGTLVRRSVATLQAGNQLLIFPEGTRTATPPVNAFKDGCGLIARKAAVPVQTVFVETDSPFLGKGWPLLRKPEFPISYRVSLGRRFEVSEDVKAFVDELEHYYRQRLAHAGT